MMQVRLREQKRQEKQEGATMILKIAIPGKMQFKMIRREPFLRQRKGDIHYIGGAEVLPPPLPTDQENRVISDLGTEYEDEAKAILIEHNLRLVVYIAKKFDNTGVGVEDLISIGTIGLIKSINTFNPEKNIKLATYASRCIENEILMYLRRNNKTKMEVSIDEPLNVDWDGNELLLSDILGTDEDVIYRGIENEVERKLLMNAVSKLSNREKTIVRLRFGLGTPDGQEMTQKEVADRMLELIQYGPDDPFAYDYNGACTAFAKGEAAMYPIGSYAIPQIQSVNPDMDIDSFVTPASNDPSENKLNSGVDLQFCVMDDCENKEAAYEVLDFLLEDENIQTYLDDQKAVPCKEGDFTLPSTLDGMKEYIEEGRMADYQDHYYPTEMAVDAQIQTFLMKKDKDAFLKKFDTDWTRYNRDIIRKVQDYEEKNGEGEN